MIRMTPRLAQFKIQDPNSFLRKQGASSFVELGAMGFIIPVMAVICVNIGVLVFAAWMNDSACRDACRAAAQQSNEENAKAAAILATKQFAADSSIIGHPIVLEDAQYFKFQTFPDADGRPQNALGPRVTVSTSLNTRLPCPIIFNGTKFTDLIVFRQSYTYPLLNPDYKDTGEGDDIDLSLALQEENSLGAEVASANTDGADETIPAPAP